MAKVIGVRFQNAGKLYFFDPGSYRPTAGDFVIVETARGVEFGEVVTGVKEIADDQLVRAPQAGDPHCQRAGRAATRRTTSGRRRKPT